MTKPTGANRVGASRALQPVASSAERRRREPLLSKASRFVARVVNANYWAPFVTAIAIGLFNGNATLGDGPRPLVCGLRAWRPNGFAQSVAGHDRPSHRGRCRGGSSTGRRQPRLRHRAESNGAFRHLVLAQRVLDRIDATSIANRRNMDVAEREMDETRP